MASLSPTRCVSWLALGVALATTAGAQIDLRCRLVHGQVLLHESIPVEVTIVNNMAEPLELQSPKARAALAFDVERAPGMFVQPTGVPVFTGVVAVAPMSEVKETVDILTSYNIRNTGPYSVSGRLTWGDRAFVAPKMFLDVLPGLEIDRAVAGVPGMPKAVRTYTLRTLNRDRMERLFLRIDDENEGQCYGVVSLGRVVRHYKPMMKVDGEGNVHVLHQAAPNQFFLHVVTPYGLVASQEQYTSEGGQMRLGQSVAGQLEVEGSGGTKVTGDSGAGGEAVEYEDLFK